MHKAPRKQSAKYNIKRKITVDPEVMSRLIWIYSVANSVSVEFDTLSVIITESVCFS